MALNRVRVAKDKADFVKALTESEGKTGPFQTYADVMVFAAALGMRRKKRVPLEAISKREPSPISLEVFISRGYDLVLKLMAFLEENDPQILSPFDADFEEKRAVIFEEYANGGLEVLREECRGAVDYSDRLLLLLMSERERDNQLEPDQEFDLTRFLN
ncbi:DNA phosphorothioation-associated protein 4 [Capilliphycus salinus ALCB114379]|uniref:DNA phosphorothioation-associated protein 4 n=1 Tax=Capilliphycus salinus TaxID=2768948 RepID=UPI0039A4770C